MTLNYLHWPCLHWCSLTSTDPHLPPLTLTYLQSPSLTSNDPHIPPLTLTYLQWPPLTSTNLYLPPLTFPYLQWPSLTSIDPHLPPLTLTYLQWPSLTSTNHSMIALSCIDFKASCSLSYYFKCFKHNLKHSKLFNLLPLSQFFVAIYESLLNYQV